MGFLSAVLAVFLLFGLAMVGRSISESERVAALADWKKSAGVVAVVVVGSALSELGGAAWLFIAAGFGAVVAGWRGSWRVVLALGAAGGLLIALNIRALGWFPFGALIVALAWCPAALALVVVSGFFGNKKIFAGVVYALALVGVFALAGGYFSSKSDAGPIAQVQQVTEKPAVAESCDCESGAVCTGPKGGKYCITKSGGKKYL